MTRIRKIFDSLTFRATAAICAAYEWGAGWRVLGLSWLTPVIAIMLGVTILFDLLCIDLEV